MVDVLLCLGHMMCLSHKNIIYENYSISETDILISYTYRLAFEGAQGQNFGMAAAVSMLIFAIVVVLTVLNFRVSKLINK